MTFSIRRLGWAGLSLGVVLAFSGSGTTSQARSISAAAAEMTVPFTYEEGRLYVPVTVGGRKLGDFILDTGFSHVVIDTAQRGNAGVVVTGQGEAKGAGAATLAMGQAGAVNLRISDAPLVSDATEVMAINQRLETYTGHPIGGIVGADFFHRYVVTIDFQQSVLELSDPSRFIYHGRGVRLPMRLVNDTPVVDGALAMPDGSTLPLRLMVDLGAKANLLVAGPFVEAHQLLQRLTPSMVEPLGAGVGGKTRYAFARLPGLELGESPMAALWNLIIGMSVVGTLRGADYDALLGARFLHRYRVTLDYAHSEIILEPARIDEQDDFDRSGAFLTSPSGQPHKVVVDEVAPGSPAAEGGLLEGDVLQALDGRPMRFWRLVRVRQRLASTTQPMVRLRAERSGHVVSVTLKLRSLL